MRQLLLLAILLAFMAGIVAWKAFSEYGIQKNTEEK